MSGREISKRKESGGKAGEAPFNKIAASKGKTWKKDLMLRSKPLFFGVLYCLVFNGCFSLDVLSLQGQAKMKLSSVLKKGL